MNEDGRVETDDERHVAGEVLEFVWLVAVNLQHSNGHARGAAVGVVNDIWLLVLRSGNS
jgi:hypothetical protein